MRFRQLRPSVGLVAAALLLVSACSVRLGAPAAASPAGGSTVPGASEDCIDIGVQSSQLPQTIATVRELATDIVVGVFRSYGPTQWNTPDGHRPTTAEVRETSVVIVRPLSIDLVSELRGDGAAAQHAIAAGGSIGCDRVSFSNDMPLLAGQRYLFFMFPVNDSVGQPSGNSLVFEAWPVGDADIVETANEGPMPLADVRNAIEDGPKPSIPPSPGEP